VPVRYGSVYKNIGAMPRCRRLFIPRKRTPISTTASWTMPRSCADWRSRSSKPEPKNCARNGRGPRPSSISNTARSRNTRVFGRSRPKSRPISPRKSHGRWSISSNAWPSVADAVHELAETERKVDEVRQARSLLEEESRTAGVDVHAAEEALGRAVAAVVASDPTRAALLGEFHRYADRALRCAQALRTGRLFLRVAEGHGLRLEIAERAVPIGEQAFFPDPEWGAALAGLRENPDFELPGLPPEPEPEPTDADSSAAA
jgi:hypothetical protein